MASWRDAKSLDTLLDQVNAAYPGRDKSNDGTIGDERHQAEHSEHNPDENGVVRARDITNDPAHGLVSRKLAESLVASRDPRILYVISNAEINSSVTSPWKWRPYNGSNPHREHMHLSVVANPTLYDSTKPWNIGQIATPPVEVAGKQTGKGSWYSQYDGEYRWVDTEDRPGSNALGVPDDCQGFSLPNHATLGKWFMVQAPSGKKLLMQQTEIGPGVSTGRKVDIAAVMAEEFGYTPQNFPTDGVFTWWPSFPPVEVANLSPKQQAIKYADIRDVTNPTQPEPGAAPPKNLWAKLMDAIFGRQA